MRYYARRNILITGVSGYLGQALLQEILNDSGVFIYGIDKDEPNTKFNHKNFKFLKADLRDNRKVENVLQNIYGHSSKPLTIAHLAALFVKDFSQRDKYTDKDYLENNLNALKNLLSSVDVKKVERFIFLSSSIAKKSTANNKGQAGKMDIYGNTKYEGEKKVRELKTEWVVVRPVRVIGTLEDKTNAIRKNNIESKKFYRALLRKIDTKEIPLDIVSQFLKNSFDEKGNPITFVVKPGNLGRTYIHLKDVTNALAKLLLSEANKNSIINVSTKNPIDLKKIAILVTEALEMIGIRARFKVEDTIGADSVYIQKSRKFAWRPLLDSSEKVVKATINQYINNVVADIKSI